MRAAVATLAAAAFATSSASALAATSPQKPQCSDRSSCEGAIEVLSAALPAKLSQHVRSAARRLLDARPEYVWEAAAAFADQRLRSADSTWCPDNGAFDLVPLTVANISYNQQSVSWGGDGCFGTVTATASWSQTGAAITLTGTNPTGLLCSDAYTAATSYDLAFPVEISTLAPTARLNLTGWAAADLQDVQLNGVKIGLFPCGLLGTITSAINTVEIFTPLSGNVSDLIGTNTRFLNGRGIWNGPTGIKSPLVPYGQFENVDTKYIRSGDYLTILRFDGLDPMIGFGTGFGGTGHSAVALWQGEGADRQLFVLEATDVDPFGPAIVFGSGIIKTPWARWLQLAQEATYHVSVLPLRPDLSAAFNETAAWAWFNSVEGTPYGYSNFLFAVLDTADPLRSLPAPIDMGMLTPVMNLVDAVLGPSLPNATLNSITVQTMLVNGLNHRMGTQCTTLACIIAATNANKAAGKAPANWVEAAAIPENDAWRYGPTASNVSFVCSAFAARVWQQGLGDLLPPFNATEQTPIDNVRFAVYDPTYWTAANCPTGLWTPNKPSNGAVCQLMGPVRMPLDGYNTVTPYAGINAACSTQWPDYVRCPNGEADCQC